jgi:hypothetical protein
MKFVKHIAVFVLVALSLSLCAFAANKNEGKFTLSDSVQLGSIQLRAGDYKATWEGAGTEVQVKILQGKNVVATVPAKLEDRPSRQSSVAIGNSNGTKTLQEVDFGGIGKALVFGSEVTAQNK